MKLILEAIDDDGKGRFIVENEVVSYDDWLETIGALLKGVGIMRDTELVEIRSEDDVVLTQQEYCELVGVDDNEGEIEG